MTFFDCASEVGVFAPGSPQWWQARRDGLGGSEIAAVVGLSPWKTACQLWHEKTAPEAPAHHDSEVMWWGRKVEPVVAELFQQHGAKRFLRKSSGMWRHNEIPFLMAEPDRFIMGSKRSRKTPRGILEIKTTSGVNRWQWGATGNPVEDIPAHYYAQVQWYLACFELPEAYLAVVFDNGRYQEHHIPASAQDQHFLLESADRFMQSIKEGTPPDWDGSDGLYEMIRARCPEIDEDREVELDREQAEALLAAASAASDSEQNFKKTRTAVLAKMGTAARATYRGVIVAKRQARKSSKPGSDGDAVWGTPFLTIPKNVNLKSIGETP